MSLDNAIKRLERFRDTPDQLVLEAARLVCEAQSPEMFEVLETASVPHWFDAAAISAITRVSHNLASEYIEKLKSLPFVEEYQSQSTWNVHETTRRVVRAHLISQKPVRFRQLSEYASSYFLNDQVQDRVEYHYHSLALTQTNAADELYETYENWRKTGRYQPLERLALVLDELIQADFLQGRNLAMSIIILGWIRGSRVNLERAKDQTHRALELFRQSGDKVGESESLDRLGNIQSSLGQLSLALNAHGSALTIRQKLVELDPSNTDWQNGLAATHSNIGRVLQAQGQLPAAWEAYQCALVIAQKLVELYPGNRDWLDNYQTIRENSDFLDAIIRIPPPPDQES